MNDLARAALILAGSGGAIHLAYVQVIRPRAEAAIEAARIAGVSAPRDWTVILKDWEQEICLVLLIFCAVQILRRMWSLASEQYLFGVDVFKTADEGASSLADTLDELETLPAEMSGTQLMRSAQGEPAPLPHHRGRPEHLGRHPDQRGALGTRFEADNAMIRYIIWAIPSIGFVGTVRGIGRALSQADEALAGDIAGMTASLGTAFNSTLVALLASLVLMLLLHALQRAQDRRLVDIQAYCEEFLLKRISR